ncbi:MAG TPA: M20 family peptidase, partial [Gemmatimonadaceae bacterium]
MKRVALGLLGVIVVLACVMIARALMLTAPAPQPLAAKVAVDTGAVRRLAEAVRIPTITEADAPPNLPQFLKLHELLRRSYPLTHARLLRETVDTGALLFTWKGSDTTLAPVVLMAHQDVVPVDPGSEKDWTHAPFSGDIADSAVWGRGTLDDKLCVLGIMEATEALLASGFKPRRTLILSFGHTEEGQGHAAADAADRLKQRGITPWFVMDEGGAVGRDLLPGIPGLVAVVGVAEKGYVSLKLTAKGDGGHSSTPPRETAVSILGAAVDRVQRTPMPVKMNDALRAMIAAIAPSVPFGMRVALANMWLMEPLLLRAATLDRSANALVRTTTAATMISGGVKDNVIPSSATATVNFRLLPGDSVAWLVRRVREIVNDPRVRVEVAEGGGSEASHVSSDTTDAFRLIAATIRETFGADVVAPYLVIGGTDGRQFERVSRSVYRFAPIVARRNAMGLVHGTNERV